MDYAQVLELARKNIGPRCKVCPDCNGLGCGNTMPGPGSKAPGNGAYDNWKAWRDIKLHMDTICPNTPIDTSTELFGRHFSMPIFTGPVGALAPQFNPGDDICDYNDKNIEACAAAEIAAAYGDGTTPETLLRGIEAGKRFGGFALPVLNPTSTEALKHNIDIINEAMPFAMSIVVDSAGLPHLKMMNADAGTKTVDQLAELKAYSKVPMIVKGIMTVKGAEKAVAAGADAVIVSNHGGRVLAGTPATAEVLPEIVKAVKGKTKIIVDGGIRSGLDIFRAIALGADAVMICRPFLISYYGGGVEGIAAYIEKLRAELNDTMYMCGARTLADIDESMIRKI